MFKNFRFKITKFIYNSLCFFPKHNLDMIDNLLLNYARALKNAMIASLIMLYDH